MDALTIVDLLLGAVLLLFGRRLFWLVIGGAGFLIGVQLAGELLVDQQQWVVVLAAVVAGVVGALLAVFLQRAAMAIAGLLAGAVLGMRLAEAAQWQEGLLIAAVVVGIIGFVLALLLTDWAIVVLSALVGAAVVVAALELDDAVRLVLFVALAALGIAVQGRSLRRRRHTTVRRTSVSP